MNIKQKLEFLKAYYEVTRKVGHSTLMKKGTDNYDKNKLVIAYDKASGKTLDLKYDEIVSWNDLTHLIGHNNPIAIDNDVMLKMLEETLEYIKELEQYKNQIIEIKKIINKDYEDRP